MKTANSVSNDRFDVVMCYRNISVGGVDLDVGEEKGCGWTKVGLPTTHAQYNLREIGPFFFNHYTRMIGRYKSF